MPQILTANRLRVGEVARLAEVERIAGRPAAATAVLDLARAVNA